MSAPESELRKTILTCAQPTGVLHLGNYLGAIRNWGTMLDDYECFFGIVDMHAITIPYTPADLRRDSLECAAQYIACGLDPERCNIFLQSHVTGHAELAWVLGCITPAGQLHRMTQWKDKSAKQGKTVGAGLLFYPILMAADILLYNAHLVPVGDDQKQHLELTRDIAVKFNGTYSPTFNVPEPFIGKTGARIMSLQDPTKKMSKSDDNRNGVVNVTDPAKTVRKKFMSAVTDSGSEVVAREDKPGITNLLTIMSAASGRPVADLEAEFKGVGYGDFKGAVADSVEAVLGPVRKRYEALRTDQKALETVLKNGADAAQKRAYKTLGKVYKKAGFVQRGR